MAKIDPSFGYDAYQFVIEGLRKADKDGVLERYMGSIQQEFERTHARTQQLLELLDPSKIDADLLKYLRASVGWDEHPEVAFVRGLNEAQLRKLTKLSVPALKRKGRPVGLKEMIRIFTGRQAVYRDWFFHRLLLEEAGAYVGLSGFDPFMVGGIFDEVGDEMSIVILNREGLDDTDRRLLYNLLTFLRPTGEHFAIVYAAFVDEFAEGVTRWDPLGSTAAADFIVTADEDVAVIDKPHLLRRMQIFDDVHIRTRADASEMATWSPHQNASMTVVNLGTTADDHIELRMMVEANGERYYAVRFYGTGLVELRRGLAGGGFAVEASVTVSLPPQPAVGSGTDPLPLWLEIQSSPQDAASTVVSVGLAGRLLLEKAFFGGNAYVDSSGGVQLQRDAGGSTDAMLIDDVMVFATPRHYQLIGQRSLLALGGIADPAPGVEPYVVQPGTDVLPPHIEQAWNDGASFGVWALGGLWHLSNFSALGPMSALWFTDGTEVGTFPNQTVDPKYTSTASLAASPTFDLSSFPSADFDVQVRIRYRPTKKIPLDGGATPQTREDLILQIDDGGGLTDHATLPEAVENGGTGFGVKVVHYFPEDFGDDRVSDGSWWQEVVVPANTLAGVAAAQIALRVAVNGTYIDTDFGIGVTYVAIEITRK